MHVKTWYAEGGKSVVDILSKLYKLGKIFFGHIL